MVSQFEELESFTVKVSRGSAWFEVDERACHKIVHDVLLQSQSTRTLNLLRIVVD